MEPKWLGMDAYVIFRTLELKFLGRSHYNETYLKTSKSHAELYLVEKICFFQIEHQLIYREVTAFCEHI